MKIIYLFFIFFMCIQFGNAQDTLKTTQDSLKLTIKQAEEIFLNKNLSLLAQKYSIDSAKATAITARLYDNPQFSFANGFYQPETKKFFDLNNQRWEIALQISQLVKTAGKRNKAIQLATSGINVAQFQFYDLLRTLRYVLRNDFYNIYFLEQSSKLYQIEINSLQKLVPIFEQQFKKGFIAFKDVLRIKSQLYTLQAEYNDLQTNIDNVQSEFRLLIRSDPGTYIIAEADTLNINTAVVSKIIYQTLLDSAIAIRPDLKALNAGITFSQNNLILQKALAKPDLTFNLNYDRLGSYVKNFNAIGVALPLPLFNRNQGNIKNATIQTEVNKVAFDAGLDKLKNDVTTSYTIAFRAEKLLLSFDPKFDADLAHLISEVFINFQKRNVTMFEFLDFYESYKQNVLQLNKLRFNKMNALEQLNFSVGKIIFNQ